ncbi:MAG: hypothetical protein J6B98_00125 [Bacilli bacterium]|nr:hypothetical protein [Bacilli bacterium]
MKDKKKIIIPLSIIAFVFVTCLTLLILGIYFTKEERFVVSKTIVNNGIMLEKTNYYVAVNKSFELDLKNPNEIEYKINIDNTDLVSLENNVLTALAVGSTGFTIEIDGFKCFNGTIYVVNGMEVPNELFNKKKKFISCNLFSEEENNILDAALLDRINDAGQNTRAGVVAAARFLTLEFAYRIPYFYENGRLNNYGDGRKVDGEGRYYHKGLYLNKSRYSSISKKFTGPGAWGCKITQYQDEPAYGFVPRVRYPNGLDCSGFVSWTLLNGGFDVGDVGAGDIISRKDDLYDLGEKNTLNSELLSSGKVKVGDLIAYSGHMAIIAGIDTEGNYYVAESLPQFKGVVLNKYDKTKLKKNFTHIMLMDSVYKKDGNLTNMWY